MHKKDEDPMANSVDPDQAALSGGSTLIAEVCLFKTFEMVLACNTTPISSIYLD